MKKIVLVSLLFILSMLCGIFAGIGFIKTENPPLSHAEALPKANAETDIDLPSLVSTPMPREEFTEKEAEVFESEQYVVTLSDTKILIYKIASDGSMQTIEEKAIDTGSIPRDDYHKLYSGIVVATLQEAKSIVEDYIS